MAQSDGNGNATTPVKASEAYRPPHARGTATPAAFKREDEGGFPPINGTNGITSRERTVPGLAPTEPKDEKKTRSRRKKDKSEKPTTNDNQAVTTPTLPVPAPIPEPPSISPEDLKKQRALLKKLRAIEERKLRQASGEKLEKTQEQKIEKEMEIAQELAKFGFTD